MAPKSTPQQMAAAYQALQTTQDHPAESPFTTLLLSIPPFPSFPHPTTHEIRIRRNAPKIPTPTDARSLFLKNLPADTTPSHLRDVFAQLVGPGRFESVSFPDDAKPVAGIDPAAAVKMSAIVGRKRKRADQEAEEEALEEEAVTLPPVWTRRLRKAGSTAIVLFADEKSVQLVLRAVAKSLKSRKYPTWGANIPRDIPPLGAPWITAHLELTSHADKAATQRAVHAFFEAFNKKEKEAAEVAKRLRNEPDEDGFVTVVRGGRTAPASKAAAEEARQKMLAKEAKKKDEMRGFYRFQLRERRKAEQGQMLKKFEEDRRRVDAMREKRGKFRPER